MYILDWIRLVVSEVLRFVVGCLGKKENQEYGVSVDCWSRLRQLTNKNV